MSTRLLALLPLLLPASAFAQLTVTAPDLEVTTLATGLAISGESMAADRFGNVYVANSGPGLVGLSSVTRIAPDGTVALNHAADFDVLGQLATNPQDGLVYVTSRSGTLPVQLQGVSRIEPTGGSTPVLSVDVLGDGFAIANDGTLWSGGSAGTGICTVPGLGAGGIATATFQDPGAGSNDDLSVLASGDVLIAAGDTVERHVPGVPSTTTDFDATPGPFVIPNEFHSVVSTARAPLNPLGEGAIVGAHTLVTVCLCGDGAATHVDPAGGATTPVLHESCNLFPLPGGSAGLVSLATGTRQDLYWLFQDGGTPAPSRTLTRVRQLPSPGAAGTLLATLTPGVVTFDVFGPPADGDPFLLGAALAPSTALEVWGAPWGVVDLFPFAGGYVPLLDGVGVFGPPNPAVVTFPGGQATAGFPLPPGFSGLSFDAQALVLSNEAPNGAFYVSNVAGFTVP